MIAPAETPGEAGIEDAFSDGSDLFDLPDDLDEGCMGSGMTSAMQVATFRIRQ